MPKANKSRGALTNPVIPVVIKDKSASIITETTVTVANNKTIIVLIGLHSSIKFRDE